MNERVLQKLEWPLLVDQLASHCQTTDGRQRCLSLMPNLGIEQTTERWRQTEPLVRLINQNYRAPIGTMDSLVPILKASERGQILSGPELQAIGQLLEATMRVRTFAADLQGRCSTLMRFKSQLFPMAELRGAIARTIDQSGQLRDDASAALQKIRRQKVSLRKKIEELLTRLIHRGDFADYIQDDFFTVRSERYVIPLRLDGRGRVQGTILDTSDSGQTLFIEPQPAKDSNDQLQELDLEEKLEILRIFRELSERIAADIDILKVNYEELVTLDVLTAEASLGAELAAGPVQLADQPVLQLVEARHPLIRRSSGEPAISNSVALQPNHRSLIISGPNAGGKTVVMKTVGLLHLMAKAGLLLPCDSNSKLHLFSTIHLEMGDAQSLTANLSTFSGHLMGLKPILQSAGPNDLVLLDELAVGTDPQTGAAIGQAILESLASRGAMTLVTTHFDALKGLAIQDDRFRNGCMEYSLQNLKPTYKLILDVPGQSYGLEVAEGLGMPRALMTRAKELKSTGSNSLDAAVSQLMEAREQALQQVEASKKEQLQAESERARWQQECELLQETRARAAERLADKYERQISSMRSEFEELNKKLRKAYKEQTGEAGLLLEGPVVEQRQLAESSLKNLEGVVGELENKYNTSETLPGKAATRDNINEGTPVFVLPLKKQGIVARTGQHEDDPIEVEVGIIKLRVSLHDLRVLSPGESVKTKVSKIGKLSQGSKGRAGGTAGHGAASVGKYFKGRVPNSQSKSPNREPGSETAKDGSSRPGFIIQTQMNSVDLRGKNSDSATQSAFSFIDRALLRGEQAVVLIHGHGEGALKKALREALTNSCPYDVRWRPGNEQEGGDGVTIVELQT